MKSGFLNSWRVMGLCVGITGVALHAEEPSLPQAAPSVAINPSNISNRADRIAWHREARFGMFIHYGIDCVAKTHYPGDAWQAHPVPAQDYHRYWLEFKLPQCDPDKWAKTCAEAGMTEFLAKPMTVQALAEVLLRALAAGEPAAAERAPAAVEPV